MKVKTETKPEAAPASPAQGAQPEPEQQISEEARETLAGLAIQKVLQCNAEHINADKCGSTPHDFLQRRWCCACYIKALLIHHKGEATVKNEKGENVKVKTSNGAKSGKAVRVRKQEAVKGKTKGLQKFESWVYILTKQATEKKLSDKQVSEWMQKEFPSLTTWKRIDNYRKDFNAGKLTGMTPTTKSVSIDPRPDHLLPKSERAKAKPEPETKSKKSKPVKKSKKSGSKGRKK